MSTDANITKIRTQSNQTIPDSYLNLAFYVALGSQRKDFERRVSWPNQLQPLGSKQKFPLNRFSMKTIIWHSSILACLLEIYCRAYSLYFVLIFFKFKFFHISYFVFHVNKLDADLESTFRINGPIFRCKIFTSFWIHLFESILIGW